MFLYKLIRGKTHDTRKVTDAPIFTNIVKIEATNC